jgi:mannan endo-1,4-beta-mannosidase
LNLSDPADSAYFLDVTAEEMRKKLVEEVKRKYKAGHIITLMWHCCFPGDGDPCSMNSIWTWDERPDKEAWDALTTDGTPLNEKWKAQVDKIAVYLKQLQEAKIPVLWRPYHEMNGVWFWWCKKSGDEGFKKLWIMMYDRMVNVHQLNNLLWVWNTNAPRDIKGDEAFAYKDFFPGIEYVDVLAADVYRNDYKQSHHDDLLELAQGKPIALGEVGEMPTPGILTDQPLWTWFMPWGRLVFKNNDPEKVKALYNAPQVLTLDEIERDEDGVYRVDGESGEL